MDDYIEMDLPTQALSYREVDDDKAWNDTPALGRYFRECMLARLREGLKDRVVVECIHHDNRRRADMRPASFFSFVRMPWGDEESKESVKEVETGSFLLAGQIRRDARRPNFGRRWESGEYLDDTYKLLKVSNRFM